MTIILQKKKKNHRYGKVKNLNKGTYHELSRQASIMSYKREIENFTMRGEDNEITEARYYTVCL